MPRRALLALIAVPSVLLCADALLSKRSGIFPNQVVGTVNVGSLTRHGSSSCGQCHFNAARVVTVTVSPQSRSLLAGASTAITIAGTSPVGTNQAGFTADVTAGTLVAGANTKVNAAGDAIAHNGPMGRSWTFNYTAPATGGLVELYTVVNAVDGNSRTTGDSWSFFGANPADNTSTPVRLFANAATGVKPTGDSCPDGFGNYPVLGAPLPPTVGNAQFRVEGHGLPPAAPLLLMFSVGGNVPPLDMAFMGAPGCLLRTRMQIQAVAATSAGNAARAEGRFVMPLPIPGNSTLKGLTFAVQFGAIDSHSKRAFPLTVTNGLECTIL